MSAFVYEKGQRGILDDEGNVISIIQMEVDEKI
jgi:hypothetical protein